MSRVNLQKTVVHVSCPSPAMFENVLGLWALPQLQLWPCRFYRYLMSLSSHAKLHLIIPDIHLVLTIMYSTS